MAERMGKPSLKVAVQQASAAMWPAQPIVACLPAFERLLCRSARATQDLDLLLLKTREERNDWLVRVCTEAYRSDPSVGPIIKAVLPSIKDDRAHRLLSPTEEDVPVIEVNRTEFCA